MEKHYEEPLWSSCLSKPLWLEVIKEGTVLYNIQLIGKPYFLVGRTPECDIQLDHPSVSRFHAVIQSDGTQVYLYDLESTHGTFLNKQKLEPRKYYSFSVGELFRFGLSTRQFVLADDTRDDEEEVEYSKSSCILKESQGGKKSNCNGVDKSRQVSSVGGEEEEEEFFETEDEERQRLEALGGFEDILGANYDDDSNDEFYDRTETFTGGALFKPTSVSYKQGELPYNRPNYDPDKTNQDEEQDELETFLERNQQILEAQKESTVVTCKDRNCSNGTVSSHDNDDSYKKEDSSWIDRKKGENHSDSQDNQSARKRARVIYGPTRASLPVYDEKLISAQMSDPDGDWQAPSGQSGDGKTWLNDVLHY